MALALAYEAAQKNQRQLTADGVGTTGVTLFTNFFGATDMPDFPHAGLSQRAPGRASRAHFHTVDQFQVVVGGHGKIGRQDLAPYSVHFSRAYTPYGPLITTGSDGLTFFFLRTRPDPGPQRLPESIPALQSVSGRDPWQITSPVMFPPTAKAKEVVIQAVPAIKDNDGLAVHTVSMGSSAVARAPDPANSDGQYLVVTGGSLWHEGKEQKNLALVFVRPAEGPFEIKAGGAGLEAIILNFPRAQNRRPPELKQSAQRSGKIWQCKLCTFEYVETAGLPQEGITAGTPWQDLPPNWSCPDCNAARHDFELKSQ